jgi:hypothetical protein
MEYIVPGPLVLIGIETAREISAALDRLVKNGNFLTPSAQRQAAEIRDALFALQNDSFAIVLKEDVDSQQITRRNYNV